MASTTTKAPQAKATAKSKADTLFDQAVGFVLRKQIEGGYVNDPRDPGGETNFGISKRAHPSVNIAALTRDGAIEIYREHYWCAANCDELPPKIAVALFDAAVNQGVVTAKKLLQNALGVSVDGVIGPITLKAVQKADEDELVIELLSWRLRRYAHTQNAFTYMRGWSARILRLLRFADQLKVS